MFTFGCRKWNPNEIKKLKKGDFSSHFFLKNGCKIFLSRLIKP